MPRIVLERKEPASQIESARVVIDRIHFDRSNAHLVREVLRSAQGVDQQMAAKAFTLLGEVHARRPSRTTGKSMCGNFLASSAGKAS